MERVVGCDHISDEGDMVACLKLRRVVVRVRIRIEVVHVVDDESTMAGSREPDMAAFY
jgi:hypothetical protein